MIVPLLSFRLNDHEIICDAGLGCENESIDQGRSYSQKNISISNCFFSRYLSYSGEGGVIYVDASSCSMNINYSMFYNCVSSGEGGAIYFSSSNSCLRMICANSCSASYEGHFAYLWASQMNQVEYLSVSNCSHTTSGYYAVELYKGNQRVDNTNSSMNNAEYVSGIHIHSPSSFISTHCTFSNNTLIQRSLEETLKETLRETVGRTYDSECEMRMLSSDLAKRKSDMYMYPIFISIVIV